MAVMVFSSVSAQCCSWVSQAGFSSVLIHCRLVLHPLGWALVFSSVFFTGVRCRGCAGFSSVALLLNFILFSLVFFTGSFCLGWAVFSSVCLTSLLLRDCQSSVQSAPLWQYVALFSLVFFTALLFSSAFRWGGGGVSYIVFKSHSP